jgi:hypothetical protein
VVHDSMVSSSIWVPLVTAVLGLVTGLGTAFFTQQRADNRENVRWQWERQDRLEQWQRERQDRLEQWQREDSQRWLKERQQAYARLITALNEWESALETLYKARWRDLRKETPTEFDMTAVRRTRDAANEALVSVRFIAPKSLRDMAQFVFSAHYRFPLVTADIKSGHQLDAERKLVLNSTERLHKLMSEDLGLEIPSEGGAPSGE